VDTCAKIVAGVLATSLRRTVRARPISRWIATVSVLLLAACTEPYGAPKIEPTYIPNGMGAGITGLVDQAATGPIKVIWTHGVCPTGVDWAVDRTLLVQAALGPGTTVNGNLEPPTVQTFPVVANIVPKGLTTASVQVYKALFETSTHRKLVAYFVVWSDIDNPNRKALAYDANDTTHHRASLNNAIKGFFDECLVDAVAYAGENGPIIRDGVAQAVAYALSQPDAMPDPQQLAYVSESLGSKILFDVINESTNSDFVRRSAQFDYFFMMANQIPILDQGVATPAATQADGQNAQSASLGRFLEKVRPYRALTRPNAIPTIVAFFDPNDLLSYELTTTIVGNQARLLNVVVSNADTWFWYLENPANAHCGYGTNQSVINLVINGNPSTGPTVPPNILELACSPSSL
jgi:hypothetical protein